jgi:hypothetical protein
MFERIDTYEKIPSIPHTVGIKPVKRHNGNSKDSHFQKKFQNQEKKRQGNGRGQTLKPLKTADNSDGSKRVLGPPSASALGEHIGKSEVGDDQVQRVDVFV